MQSVLKGRYFIYDSYSVPIYRFFFECSLSSSVRRYLAYLGTWLAHGLLQCTWLAPVYTNASQVPRYTSSLQCAWQAFEREGEGN